jgi:hypothetical protein
MVAREDAAAIIFERTKPILNKACGISCLRAVFRSQFRSVFHLSRNMAAGAEAPVLKLEFKVAPGS